MRKALIIFYSFPLITLTLLMMVSLYTFKGQKEISAEDFKCLKCHKGKDSLEKYVQEKKITTGAQLRDLIRKGPKAGLHITSSDEDIDKAIKYLNLP
ncbi:MAG: hypothetical protein ACK4UR_04410 [Caldimicrobium sp.]